jgi:hypothetical protein
VAEMFGMDDRRLKQILGREKVVDISRGIDLSAVRNKRSHQHRFVMVAKFRLPASLMAKIVENDLKGQNSGVAPPPIPLAIGQENLVELMGPGCSKCGIIHTDPVNGYGHPCPEPDPEGFNDGLWNTPLMMEREPVDVGE